VDNITEIIVNAIVKLAYDLMGDVAEAIKRKVIKI